MSEPGALGAIAAVRLPFATLAAPVAVAGGCDDDSGGGLTSAVGVRVTAGRTYFIYVPAPVGAAQVLRLEVTLAR